MLKEIIKHTDETNLDYSILKEAKEKVCKMNEIINQEKKKKDLFYSMENLKKNSSFISKINSSHLFQKRNLTEPTFCVICNSIIW